MLDWIYSGTRKAPNEKCDVLLDLGVERGYKLAKHDGNIFVDIYIEIRIL